MKLKKATQSMKKDRVSAFDFLSLNAAYACEDCAHFCPKSESCTMGFESQTHRKEKQLKQYFLSGEMQICRFLEVE